MKGDFDFYINIKKINTITVIAIRISTILNLKLLKRDFLYVL